MASNAEIDSISWRHDEHITTLDPHISGDPVAPSVPYCWYRKTFNISRTLLCNKIIDNSDVVRASPVGAAPTTSSFST